MDRASDLMNVAQFLLVSPHQLCCWCPKVVIFGDPPIDVDVYNNSLALDRVVLRILGWRAFAQRELPTDNNDRECSCRAWQTSHCAQINEKMTVDGNE